MSTVEVAPAQQGIRLDAFLVAAGLAKSASAARKMIAARRVRVNGRPGRKGTRALTGQTVEVQPAAEPAEVVSPAGESGPVPLRILYEDRDLIAIDKPSGIPAQALRAGEQGTLANAICARYPECASASADAREGGLAHRLDRGTSGVIVAARHAEAWRRLRVVLVGPDCWKTYLAEVVGLPDARNGGEFVVDAPIGRKGRRGSSVKVDGGRQPLAARTEFTIVEKRGATTLMAARLHRGRTHQIRAHLAHIGCPILGDRDYGGEAAWALAAKRKVWQVRLHALAIDLPHPMTGQTLHIEAPRPAWAR